jgi:hypothetical protein
MSSFDYQTLQQLSGGAAEIETTCPACSAGRKPFNRNKKVLKIWNRGPGFATYGCAHCGEAGYAHDSGKTNGASRASEDDVAKRVAAAIAAPRLIKTEPAPDKSATARYLWSQRRPIAGTIAERGYHGPLPETLGFLPANGEYLPAMIAVFGRPSDVTNVHITKLRRDGSGKADVEPAKIMVGPSNDQPIMLRPVNGLGGLLIAEGIENTLACHASGLGLWAAGCAGRLPAIADKVPAYVEAVTIVADTDDSGAGLKFSKQLGQLLLKRGFEVFLEMGGPHG